MPMHGPISTRRRIMSTLKQITYSDVPLTDGDMTVIIELTWCYNDRLLATITSYSQEGIPSVDIQRANVYLLPLNGELTEESFRFSYPYHGRLPDQATILRLIKILNDN